MKAFEARFPGTPYALYRRIIDVLQTCDTGKPMHIHFLLQAVGMAWREYLLGKNGSSHSACWEFSRHLRDIYNYLFRELRLPFEAHMIFGIFGETAHSPHNWVGVASTMAGKKSFGVEEFARLSIVDGTTDQFCSFHGIHHGHQECLRYPTVHIIGPDHPWHRLFCPEGVSPVEPCLFVEKNAPHSMGD